MYSSDRLPCFFVSSFELFASRIVSAVCICSLAAISLASVPQISAQTVIQQDQFGQTYHGQSAIEQGIPLFQQPQFQQPLYPQQLLQPLQNNYWQPGTGTQQNLLPVEPRQIQQSGLVDSGPQPAAGQPGGKYAIAIHGGAGSAPGDFPDVANNARRASMDRALTVGNDVLKNGGSALDAVEQVVVYLENDPQFNAGVGAVFNEFGSHELDASIMDGRTRASGAVAGVSRVKNPISLARRVLTDTPHAMLGGNGAEQFASQLGMVMVDPRHFDTPSTMQHWLKSRVRNATGGSSNKIQQRFDVLPNEPSGSTVGTVGCVALDSAGNLAAATSTGGMSNKRFGRIGDSPITGAGNYADNATCACSGTGTGEQYIRNMVCYDVSAQMKYAGRTLDEAVRDNLENRLEPEDGGIIAIDHEGNITMQFSTEGMCRAAADSNGRFEVLWDE